jgi:transcriptional regulator GlxA family with amidase domain
VCCGGTAEQWPDAAAVQQRADYLKAVLSAAPNPWASKAPPASEAKAFEQRRRRRLPADHPQSALRSATDAIAADPAADHSVNNLAATAAMSTRQLTRLFHTELGTTPARYVEMVRIDAARAALDAGRSVAETARLARFGSAETLRRVFVNHLGLSPKAYRDRFHTTSPG